MWYEESCRNNRMQKMSWREGSCRAIPLSTLPLRAKTSAAYGAALPVLAQVLSEVRQMERQDAGSQGTQALLWYYGLKKE